MKGKGLNVTRKLAQILRSIFQFLRVTIVLLNPFQKILEKNR